MKTIWLYVFAALLSITLTGCAPAALQVRAAPAVIDSVREIYVPIPAEYTIHCPIAEGKNLTEDELYNVAKARKDAEIKCNIRFDIIHAIQGTPVK